MLGVTSASNAPPAAAQPADTTPPVYSSVGGDLESDPFSIPLGIRDVESGLASVVVIRSDNADTVVPPFTPGTTDEVLVTPTVIDQTQHAYVSIVASDVAGNSTTFHGSFDPVNGAYLYAFDRFATVEPDQSTVEIDVWFFASGHSGDYSEELTCTADLVDASFPIGATTPTCSYPAGIAISATITVLDPHPPSITAPSDTFVANDPGQPGAYVSYPAPIVADNDPNLGSPVCNPTSGSFFPVGTTTVNCSITDPSGNTASASFDITVSDTEAPSFGTPANVTVNATSPTGAVVNYALPAASDNAPGMTVACTPPPGSTFPAGTTPVTCTATDGSGNTANSSFTVTVIGAGELLAQLRAETIDRVSNPTAERALVATVDQARSAAASGNSFGVYLALLKYVIQLDAYESRRMVTSAAANQLATLTLTALDAAR
jgi:hypothetical protein